MTTTTISEKVSLHSLAERHAFGSFGDAAHDFETSLAAFQRDHGAALDYYFCRDIPAGAVQTGDRLHLTYVPVAGAPQWIAQLLSECDLLATEIRQTLRPSEGRVCMELLFALVARLLRFMEAAVRESRRDAADSGSPHLADEASAQDLYRAQLARVRGLYEITAQRSAQTAYFVGMIGGLLVLGLIAGVVAAFQPTHVSWWVSQPAFILQSLVVGGIGAVVSVMHRTSSGALSLKHRAGPLSLAVAGASRPLVGAIFGLMAYVLLMADLLPVRLPPDTDAVRFPFFLAAIAFFTGFAERLAQDMLTTREAASAGVTEPLPA